ncbi:DUF5086 domain-containing protein [Pseudomonas sp. CCM 7891]|uniref:DUF5086 domain-containing protein n=1 Tax=Pseudomonas karstica TaxID=1055468 RepID=A0A7X2UZT9_9PSED|nr:DUF5086 family protein [Pseudomonas karstica]MTD20517.1 DUF5086 domain-containing protein [Pseudomonas karstica]
MLKRSRLITTLAFLGVLTSASAQAQEHQESVVLSASPKIVQWAEVYKVLPQRPDDPYYHVRVIERHKGSQPWAFKELVFHMAVTPKALEASRTHKKAKIYSYKDVEIRSAYHRWLDDPATRPEVPVCDTDILSCIKQLPR